MKRFNQRKAQKAAQAVSERHVSEPIRTSWERYGDLNYMIEAKQAEIADILEADWLDHESLLRAEAELQELTIEQEFELSCLDQRQGGAL